jgi:hypothetical protein
MKRWETYEFQLGHNHGAGPVPKSWALAGWKSYWRDTRYVFVRHFAIIKLDFFNSHRNPVMPPEQDQREKLSFNCRITLLHVARSIAGSPSCFDRFIKDASRNASVFGKALVWNCVKKNSIMFAIKSPFQPNPSIWKDLL